MKTDGRLGRNYLVGEAGDVINAILSGCGQNLRLLLGSRRFAEHIFLFLHQIRTLLRACPGRLFSPAATWASLAEGKVGFSGTTSCLGGLKAPFVKTSGIFHDHTLPGDGLEHIALNPYSPI